MSCVACNLFWKIPNVRWPIWTKQNHKTQTRVIKTQNSKQNLKTLKQNHKTQNRIAKFETESQNSKQNHKTQSKNRIAKPKTKSKHSKQNRKTQNRNTKLKTQNTKLKTETQNPKRKYKIDNRKKKPVTQTNRGLARLLRQTRAITKVKPHAQCRTRLLW